MWGEGKTSIDGARLSGAAVRDGDSNLMIW